MPAVDRKLTRYSFGFFETPSNRFALKRALELAFKDAQINSSGTDMDVIVIGCNTGHEFPTLEEMIKARTGKQPRLLGLDIVVRYIQQAQQTYRNKNYFFRAVDAAQLDEVKDAIKTTLGTDKVDMVVFTHPYLSTIWPFSYTPIGQKLLNKFSDMLTQIVPKILRNNGTLLGVFVEDERLIFNDVVKSTFLQGSEPCNKLFTRHWATVPKAEWSIPYGQFTIVTHAYLNQNAKKYFLTPENVNLSKLFRIRMYNLILSHIVNPIVDTGLDIGISRINLSKSIVICYYLCLLLGAISIPSLPALLFYALSKKFNPAPPPPPPMLLPTPR